MVHIYEYLKVTLKGIYTLSHNDEIYNLHVRMHMTENFYVVWSDSNQYS